MTTITGGALFTLREMKQRKRKVKEMQKEYNDTNTWQDEEADEAGNNVAVVDKLARINERIIVKIVIQWKIV